MKKRAYDRHCVEVLLPTLWTESVAYGMSQENPPDPMMPKAKANPAHGNVLVAMMADMQRGWVRCPLTYKERVALILRYGFDWTEQSIGLNQGVSHQAAQRRIERGVGRLTAYLNRDTYHDNYDKEEGE